MGNCYKASENWDDHDPEDRLMIEVETWGKHQQSLFDFDSTDTLRNKLSTSLSGHLVSLDQRLSFQPILSSLDHGLPVLQIHARPASNGFSLSPTVTLQLPTQDLDSWSSLNRDQHHLQIKTLNSLTNVWHVLSKRNKLKRQVFPLDIIKIGKVFIKILEINIFPEIPLCRHIASPVSSQSGFCRICLEGPLAQEELITPCACRGSIGMVHTGCLRHWVKSQLVQRDSQHSILVEEKPYVCEVCKQIDRSVLEQYLCPRDLLRQDPPGVSHLLLQVLYDNQHTRHYSVLPLETQTPVGRGLENHLILHEMSVSRCHASFLLQGQKVFLQDSYSKFGTLVLMNGAELLSYKTCKQLYQVGQQVVQLKVNRPFMSRVRLCCQKKRHKTIHSDSTKKMEWIVSHSQSSFS